VFLLVAPAVWHRIRRSKVTATHSRFDGTSAAEQTWNAIEEAPMPARIRELHLTAAALLSCLSFASIAHAGAFGTPVALSLNGHAATASVAMDMSGNALATWADAGMYYSDRPAGGSWSAPLSVYVGGAFPVLHMTDDGTASIVSYSSGYGIWSVDRPPGGAWTSPDLIVNAPEIVGSVIQNVAPVQFLSNANGDQAIVFQQRLGGNVVITAVRRPSGGAWSAQDDVASSADYGDITLTSSALGGNGDLVVAFETYEVVCNKYCHELNFAVHAAREAAGTTNWIDSGALTPQSSSYNTRTVVDSTGHAGVFIQNGFSAVIQASTQKRAGAKWSPLVDAFDGAGSNGAQIWLAEANAKGDANLALCDFTASGAFAAVLEGNVATDSWLPISILSGADIPGANDNIVFDSNPKGGAVTEWTDTDGTVRSALRRKAGAAWGNAQMIVTGSACNVGGVVCTGAVASAINANGRAVIGYIRFDPTVTVATFYVATN
jgi:hypothetical protein